MLVLKRKETNDEQLHTKKLVALIGLIANRQGLNIVYASINRLMITMVAIEM